MREEIKRLAQVLFISNYNRELTLTGSVALKVYGINLEREVSYSDVDFYDSSTKEVCDCAYCMPPFTKEIDENKAEQVLIDEYDCKQYLVYDKLKIDILGERKYDFNCVDWFEPYSVKENEECIFEFLHGTTSFRSEYEYVQVSDFLKTIIPNITSEEIIWVNNYSNCLYNSIRLDRIDNIGNAKLTILCNKYGDKLEFINVDKIKQDKHYKDLVVINDFLKQELNLEYGVIPCSFKV